MPMEYLLLKNAPVWLDACPVCGAWPFEPWLRGTVQRSKYSPLALWWRWRGRYYPYCALICTRCGHIVGYE